MKSPAGVSNLKNCGQAAAILLCVWMLYACDQRNEYVEPPPPKVTTAKPLQQEIIDYLEFTGTTHAFEEAEVRARVAGFLQSMEFTPGTSVEKGDLLFVIDPREYEAELNAANAELSSAEAQFKRAQIEFARAEKLFKQKAGAETDVVKWRGQRDVAGADVLRAKAKVEKAGLDLSYTQVTSPLTGRVSRNFVDLSQYTWQLMVNRLREYLKMPYPIKPAKRIEIRQINKLPAAESPVAIHLLETGFEKDGTRLVLWPSAI